MRRHVLLISAVVLLVCSVAIRIFQPDAELSLAFCWRAGAVLAAAWLAFDDVQRLPNWILVSLPVLLIVLARWPRLIPAAVIAIIGFSIFRRFLSPKA